MSGYAVANSTYATRKYLKFSQASVKQIKHIKNILLSNYITEHLLLIQATIKQIYAQNGI